LLVSFLFILKCEFILITVFGANDYYKRHNYKLFCEKNRIHLASFLCKGSLKSTRAVFAEKSTKRKEKSWILTESEVFTFF